jgi:hypothetical protein
MTSLVRLALGLAAAALCAHLVRLAGRDAERGRWP